MHQIEADEIIVEVKDKQTGRLIRRSFPIMYFEDQYKVIMVGEDGEMNHTNFVYYTEEGRKALIEAYLQKQEKTIPH